METVEEVIFILNVLENYCEETNRYQNLNEKKTFIGYGNVHK